MNGVDDPHIQGAALDGWSRECAHEPVRHSAAGGHFYFEQHPTALTDLLRSLTAVEHDVELI